MKRKIIQIFLPLIIEMLKEGKEIPACRIISSPIKSESSKIVDIKYDGFLNAVSILIEDESFPEIKKGELIPIEVIEVKTIEI